MTVVGAGGSSSRDRWRGRFAPHVKQIKSSARTSAAQFGQLSVAIRSSCTCTQCSHERVTRPARPMVPGSESRPGRRR